MPSYILCLCLTTICFITWNNYNALASIVNSYHNALSLHEACDTKRSNTYTTKLQSRYKST